MSEEEKGQLPDDLFRDGLNHYQPEPGEGLWNRLQENLHQEGRYHETDDIFHEGLSNFSPEPPGNVWDRLHKNLETPAEFKLANSLSGYEPQPPHWVWQSLRYMMQRQRNNKIVFRTAALALLIGGIALFFMQNGKVTNHQDLLTTRNQSSSAEKDFQSDHFVNSHYNPSKPSSKETAAKSAFKTPFQNTTKVLALPEIASLSPGIFETKSEIPELFSGTLKPMRLFAAVNLMQHPKVIQHQKNGPKKRLKSGQLILHLSVGNDRVSGQVSANAGHEDYLNIRKNSERNIITKGFYTGMEYRKGLMSLMAGLRYSQRGEDAVYNFKTYVQTSTDIQFFNQNNHTYFSVPYQCTLTYDHQKVTQNRLTAIEIPVSVGINLSKGRWTITPYAGLRTGLMIYSGGTILSPVDDPAQLALNEAGLSSYCRCLVSADAGVRAGLCLHPKLSLTTGVLFNQTLNNVLGKNSGIKQSYQTWNLSGGIAWKL